MTDVPDNLSYTADHEWIATGEVFTVGITAHAAAELGEVVFVELPVQGAEVAAGATCGEIESTKAVSEIYAPVAGEVVEVNQAAVDAPESISEDPYGAGWLFKIRATGGESELLDAQAYRALIA